MAVGHPENPAHACASDERLVRIVSRVAFSVASVVLIALPLAYWSFAYQGLGTTLAYAAKIKATALSPLATASPDVWMHEEPRLRALLEKYPVSLETESTRIYGAQGNLVAESGEMPASPVLSRSAPVYDSGRVVGRVEVNDSLRAVVVGTGIATLLGMLLAAAVIITLRVVPLRALRYVTDALFAQKELAQVTLNSIGEAVIATDQGERVKAMNPTAEILTGWDLREVSGKPLSEVLKLCDATTGTPTPNPLQQALAENQIVAFDNNTDLVRRDASRLAIADSAAPIHDRSGKVVGGILIFRDVSTARESDQRSSWEATHDPLTGLVNGREFEGLIEVAVASAQTAGKHHVVCCMNLDQFKVVNDTTGHAGGDVLLKEIAALLQSRIRESDTLARLGGDEFGVILDGCSLERAKFIAADLLAAVRDFRFVRDAKMFTIGVSIGLATVTGESSGSEVLSMADTACYWAKQQGRNRVCVYLTGDSDMAARRHETGWVTRIKHALAEDRFTLYHQSYLSLSTAAGAGKHLEVLLRMIDEKGNLVQPGSFLPAAERYNLMPAIDRWVVGTVFAGYRALIAERGGGALLTCAINLSGTSLNSEGFLDFIRQLALKHALPPHSVCFEITETAAINNLRKAAEFIRECKSMGFLFALDDFGAGMSSFGYLKNLPVDYLKIDGGFVKNLEHDAIDKAMTDTINRIGHIMGIKTVAEYAENDAIIQEVRRIGVDYAQGYGIDKPAPLFKRNPRAVAFPEAVAAFA